MNEPSYAAHEQARAALQGELDALHDGDTLQLLPREFAGPLVLRHRLTLDGHGATIWALKGPVVFIQEAGSQLRNLKIEVTGEGRAATLEDECALLVKPGQGVHCENVEVRGSVIGLPAEEGEWRYPYALQLGHLTYGRPHEFILRIVVPVPCRITSHIAGLEVEPHRLSPGIHDVRLHIERLPQDTLLNGHLSLVTTMLTRRLQVSAYVLASQSTQSSLAVEGQGQVIWEPQDRPALDTDPKPESQSAEQVPLDLPPQEESITPADDVLPFPNAIESPVAAKSPHHTAPHGSPETPRSSPSPTSLPPVQPNAPTSVRSPVKPPSSGIRRRSDSPLSNVFLPPTGTREAEEVAGTEAASGSKKPGLPLSEAFLQSAEPNESAETAASAATSACKRIDISPRQGTPQLSPLFHTQEPETQHEVPSQDQATAAPDRTVPAPIPSPPRSVRSKPTSPLFGQEPPSGHTEDKAEAPVKKESAPGDAAQDSSRQRKRRIVRSGGVSPLFGESEKTQQGDQDKESP